MPKSSPSFNYHIDILTVMESAEWPWSSFVLLYSFINVLVGKTLGHIASTWCMKVCLFIYFKVTFIADIFKSISFLLYWKIDRKNNNLLNSANAKSEWRQYRFPGSLRNWKCTKLLHGCLHRQNCYKEIRWDQMSSSICVFEISPSM